MDTINNQKNRNTYLLNKTVLEMDPVVEWE